MLEALRCPAPHPGGPLIAAVQRREGDDVRTATLGCPACGAEYPVVDGIADLGAVPHPAGAVRPDDEALMRAGALLGLVGGGGTVALAPTWAEYAHPLAALTDVAAVVVGPPPGFSTGSGVSAVRGVRALPFAPATFRGVALDAWVAADPVATNAWVMACRPSGRIMAPTDVPVPTGVRELARDATHWVGEREASVASAPVTLRRSGAT